MAEPYHDAARPVNPASVRRADARPDGTIGPADFSTVCIIDSA